MSILWPSSNINLSPWFALIETSLFKPAAHPAEAGRGTCRSKRRIPEQQMGENISLTFLIQYV
jgi:hypothetical protein